MKSLKVKTFTQEDTEEIRKILSNSPVILQQYVSSLRRSLENSESINTECVKKIKELTNEDTNRY
jgi:hypothetical protein